MGSSSRLTLLLTSPCLSLLLHHRPSHFRLARLSLSSAIHRLSRPSLISIKATHHIHTQISTNSSSSSNSSTLKEDNFGDSHSFLSNPRASHPWPEWSHLVHALSTAGYFDQQHHRFGDGITVRQDDDEYVAYETLSEEFVRVASACLAFARNRSDILGSLSRRDIMVIVENGSPFLFKSALDSSRRMRFFLASSRTNVSQVLEPGEAELVDLMKYLLSYASNPSVSVSSSESNNLYNRDKIESSVRNLLSELAEMMSNSSSNRAEEHYQQEIQTPRPLVGQQNIQMKRGDWICKKCTFMNFARNNKCLECEEPRPKRQLSGGEWECPQCDFFNYGRNMMCLRCDCKRPSEVLFGTSNRRPAYNGDYAAASKKADVDTSNQEKAERWFNSVSQQNNVSDLPDEDFPEIMPLRKGENRFVVSTRKTPLERRLEKSNETDSNQPMRTVDSSSINRSLDQVLGPTSSRTETRSANNSSFTPFVPLPADMFAKKSPNSQGSSESVPSKSSDQSGPVSSGERIVEDNKEGRKPDRWFEKVEELHGVNNSNFTPTQNEDNYLPEMMPMRKGENRFVVSKQKDRSFTSPTYKRQMAVEQATESNSKFVPFVPFPPDYFAKKDQKQQPSITTESTVKNFTTNETSSSSTLQNTETQQTKSFTSQSSIISDNKNLGGENKNITSGNTSSSGWSGKSLEGSAVKETNSGGENKNIRSSSSGWNGKSLEGSAVKETDPLDMSEEAKAERWFRRVAQIKDISELSQIPDEDFPSIMPMRKGVNRFVVSKRKTPLERRLTSPQYRRNLPIFERTDPPSNKENNDGN